MSRYSVVPNLVIITKMLNTSLCDATDDMYEAIQILDHWQSKSNLGLWYGVTNISISDGKIRPTLVLLLLRTNILFVSWPYKGIRREVQWGNGLIGGIDLSPLPGVLSLNMSFAHVLHISQINRRYNGKILRFIN